MQRGREQTRSGKVGVPGLAARAGAVTVGGGVGAACAVFLDDAWGFYWFVGSAITTVVVAFALLLDRGYVDGLDRELDPKGVQPYRACILLLVLLAQLPAIGWRLHAGEPNARVARSYVETILPELRSRVAADPAAAENNALPAPDLATGLPAAYPANGLTYGTLDGELWVEFETGGLLTGWWRLDPIRGWYRVPREIQEDEL